MQTVYPRNNVNIIKYSDMYMYIVHFNKLFAVPGFVTCYLHYADYNKPINKEVMVKTS